MTATSESAAPAARLAVTRLVLTQFRNYESMRLAPDPRPVVLTGPNGAGKTNLLEAVSLLAPGRGLRRAKLSDVSRIGAPPGTGWAVAATVETPAGPVEIGTGLEAGDDGERRAVRIDGQNVRGQAALADHVAIVWLTPAMDRLFMEASSGRRRFLDRLVYGFDPGHARQLARYEHALRERARLLRERGGDATWLGTLEDTMATTGVAVAAARRDAVARLEAACRRGIGPFPQAGLALDGTVEQALEDQPALAVEDLLRERLRASRRRDAEAGGAAEGPHRTDLKVRHVAKDLPAELCSTGEQKALLIAIVLANARLMAADRGFPPLMLLDEVAAHLDSGRRAALYDEILALGAQAWLTGTDFSMFQAFGSRAQHYIIEDSTATPHAAESDRTG